MPLPIPSFLERLATAVRTPEGFRRHGSVVQNLSRVLLATGTSRELLEALSSSEPEQVVSALGQLATAESSHPHFIDIGPRLGQVFPTATVHSGGDPRVDPLPPLWREVAARRLALDPDQLREVTERSANRISQWVEGTGAGVSAVAFRAEDFRRLAPGRLRQLLERQYTTRERGRLGTEEGRGEKYWGRLASMGAMKAAVLDAIGLDRSWVRDWACAEFRLGRPVFLGHRESILGDQALLASAADDGDVAIAIALLETALGASGLVGIGVDVTTDRVRYVAPEQHALAEAVYKAVYRAHPIRQFARGMSTEVLRRDDRTYVAVGLMAEAARRLRGEPPSRDPLPIQADVFRVGPAVVAVAAVPAPEPHLSHRLDLLLGMLAQKLSRFTREGLRNSADRVLRLITMTDVEPAASFALSLIGIDIRQQAQGVSGRGQDLHHAVSLLSLLGLSPSEMDRLIRGAGDHYSRRRTIGLHRTGQPTFGYPWSLSRKGDSLAVDTEAFQDLMAVEGGQTLLDPMTGLGLEPIALLRRTPGLKVVAFDAGPANLLQAAINADAAGVPREALTLHLRDIRAEIPVADNSIDRIMLNSYSTFGWRAEGLVALWRELLSKARDGARIWVDFLPFPKPLEEAHIDVLRRVAIEQGILLHPLPVPAELNAYAFLIIKSPIDRWADGEVRAALASGPEAMRRLLRHVSPPALDLRPAQDPLIAVLFSWQKAHASADEALARRAEEVRMEIIGRMPQLPEELRRRIATGEALGPDFQRNATTMGELEEAYVRRYPQSRYFRFVNLDRAGRETVVYYLRPVEGDGSVIELTIQEMEIDGALHAYVSERVILADASIIVPTWEDLRPIAVDLKI